MVPIPPGIPHEHGTADAQGSSTATPASTPGSAAPLMWVSSNDDTRKAARSHVMREYWRTRDGPRTRFTGDLRSTKVVAGPILPKDGNVVSNRAVPVSSSTINNHLQVLKAARRMISADESGARNMSTQDRALVLRKPTYLRSSSSEDTGSHPNVYLDLPPPDPHCLLCVESLGEAPVKLDSHAKSLLHYLLGTANDILYGANRKPLRNAWFSLETQSKASFYSLLAYAAMHRTYIYKDAQSSSLLLRYQALAIREINDSIKDGKGGIGDEIIAAVIRQTLLEESLGSLETYLCHRRGLAKLIELRGGRERILETNWQLEMMYTTTILLRQPRWARPSPIPNEDLFLGDSTSTDQSVMQELNRICVDFVQVLNDLSVEIQRRNANSDLAIANLYPQVYAAVHLLSSMSRHPESLAVHKNSEEAGRVVILIYFCLIVGHSLNSSRERITSLDQIEYVLRAEKDDWPTSVEFTGHILLKAEYPPKKENSRTMPVVKELMDMVSMLGWETWSRVREVMVQMLLGDAKPKDLEFLTSDLLFDECTTD